VRWREVTIDADGAREASASASASSDRSIDRSIDAHNGDLLLLFLMGFEDGLYVSMRG